MKIAFYSSYFHPYLSGLTIYPQKVLQHLSSKNNITVLAFCHDENLKVIDHVNKLKIIRMPFLFRISKGFISSSSISYFRKSVEENDTIIVNLPNVEALPLVILAKLKRRKVISIYHCQVFLGPGFLLRMISAILNLSVFLQLFFSEIIIACPDYVENRFFYKFFKNKIKLCFPLVEEKPISAAFLSQLKKEKEKKVWIGFVGRIAREKGIEFLIKAISELSFKKNVELVFVGPSSSDVVGEGEYFKKIQTELNEHQIAYKFLGKISDQDLGAFYKAIDVLVLPSVNSTEAFGMVQVEAIISGTPVVASDLPGVRLPVVLTGMGLLAKPASWKSLNKAIINVVQNRKEFSAEALVKEAKNIFDPRKTLEVFRAALAE